MAKGLKATEELCALAWDWIDSHEWIRARTMVLNAMEDEAERACKMKKGKERRAALAELEFFAERVCGEIDHARRQITKITKWAGRLLKTDDIIDIDHTLRGIVDDCVKKKIWPGGYPESGVWKHAPTRIREVPRPWRVR